MQKSLSIIVPCYNESATIADVVAKVAAAPLPNGWGREIIVVDDGSDAATKAALKPLEAQVRVIYREQNGGKGAAVKDGLHAARGEYCIVQDADLELDPRDIAALLTPIITGDADAAFGYRVLAAQTRAASPTMFYGGKMISTLYNIVFGTKLKDVPCGYKLFPHRTVPALLACPSDDFVFDAFEMTRAILAECRVAQVPVSYMPRSHAEGKKIRISHGVYTALAILFIRAGIHKDPVPQELARLGRYGAVGIATVALNLVVFSLLTSTGLWYEWASAIAFVASYAANFTLHKFWTFQNYDAAATKRQLPLHLGLALINLGINVAVLYVLVALAHLPQFVGQLGALIFVALESFVLLSRYIF